MRKHTTPSAWTPFRRAQAPAYRVCGKGFSLVEVMVALVVINIGLLGVAKIQALALSSTGTARMRSLVSIEAASLASTLRADRNYWGALTTDPAVSISVATAKVTAADISLTTPPSGGCTATAPCTVNELAAQDLHDWTLALQATLPANTVPTATVHCQGGGGITSPVTCAIQLSWTENLVATPYSTNTAATAQQNAQAVQGVEPTAFVLYTDP